MSARAWKRRRNKPAWAWLNHVAGILADASRTRVRLRAMGMSVTAGEWWPTATETKRLRTAFEDLTCYGAGFILVEDNPTPPAA